MAVFLPGLLGLAQLGRFGPIQGTGRLARLLLHLAGLLEIPDALIIGPRSRTIAFAFVGL